MKELGDLDPMKRHEDEFYSKAFAIAVKAGGTLKTISTALNATLVTLAILALLVFAWMLIDRRVPTTIEAVEIATPRIRQGEDVKVHFVVTRDRSCETEASYDIIDARHEIRHYDPVHQDVMSQIGVPDDVIKAFHTPMNAAIGQAHIRLKWSWQCPVNLVHEHFPVTMVWPDMPFEIAPR